MEYDVKSFAVTDIKMLSEEGEFEGYASTFNNIDSYNDVCVQGCFKETIRGRVNKIRMFWNHKMDSPIGIWKEMHEDAQGLYVRGQLNLETTLGRDAHALLKQGAIDSMSIGYTVKQHEYDVDTNIRKLKEIKLYEISLVTIPANEMAEVTGVKNTQVEQEATLLRINKVFDEIDSLKSVLINEIMSLKSNDPQSSLEDTGGADPEQDTTAEQSETKADGLSDESREESAETKVDDDLELQQSLEQLLKTFKNEV